MRTYSVYRVDYAKNMTVKIGKVQDRREGERKDNPADMLRLANMKYPASSVHSHIFILRESSNRHLLSGVGKGT